MIGFKYAIYFSILIIYLAQQKSNKVMLLAP
jgi:hypothetical protein